MALLDRDAHARAGARIGRVDFEAKPKELTARIPQVRES
jgi:hypothetical protein|eukprot:COSAG02_NODE_1799_length_10896_cov_8.648421_16_plen_39_part_00